MKTYKLYGAILGDLAGQPYEFPPMKGPYTNVDIHNPLAHITDDTVMTLASAACILKGSDPEHEYRYWGAMYPEAGYGAGFKNWLIRGDTYRSDSWANGCLMRASPFIYANDLPGLIRSIQVSHNHQDSYEAVLQLRDLYKGLGTGLPQRLVKFEQFKVDAKSTISFCSDVYDRNKSTQELIINAIECGGDTDTNASIVGELSNSWKKDITKEDAEYVESKLDEMQLKILLKFNK